MYLHHYDYLYYFEPFVFLGDDPFKIYLRICFYSVYEISGLAVQGQGNDGNVGRVLSYLVKFGYSKDKVIYDYQINGKKDVSSTKPNKGKCFCNGGMKWC